MNNLVRLRRRPHGNRQLTHGETTQPPRGSRGHLANRQCIAYAAGSMAMTVGLLAASSTARPTRLRRRPGSLSQRDDEPGFPER